MADNVYDDQGGKKNATMNTIGWIMATLLFIVLLPLLPVFLLYLAVDRLVRD